MKPTVFPTQPYKGTRDFYPEDLAKRNYIFQVWRRVLKRNGFLEYETSLLENADLYIAKSGQELGGKQLYNFTDKGNRFVALRPEQTPSLARLVAHRYRELKFPLRWFSIPNCFRYEQPQKGRFREHWQLNVDIIGQQAGAVELELLNLVGELFKSFGANKQHYKVMYNHRQLLDQWIVRHQLGDYRVLIYTVYDDWFKKTLAENIRELENPTDETIAGISDKSQIQVIVDLAQRAGQSWDSYLEIAKSFDELNLVLKHINEIQPEATYELNPCIIRGIAYYTGLVFEAFDENPKNPRALFGGGRYDNLMELFGKEAHGIGFGWGDATMHEFLSNWNLYPDLTQGGNLVGIMPFTEADLTKIYLKIIPDLKKHNKRFLIDYDYSRNQEKRWIALKKRGCQEIIKLNQDS
ncbi:MAG: ATP phosphoribosyltransferase regulatory subunit [Patescibacteria group bacterium]